MLVGSLRGVSQELVSDLIDQQPTYILISDAALSKPTYFEEENYSRAGYRYRIITTTSEIYNSLFIEKIIIDIEESPVGLEFSKEIRFNEIYECLELSEETDPVEFEKWLTANRFIVRVGKVLLKYEVVDKEDSFSFKITKL